VAVADAPEASVTVTVTSYVPAAVNWINGFAVKPPGMETEGYPGAACHEKVRPPAALLDPDASKLTWLESTWNVFVAEVAPPGPVITIVIPLGGGGVVLPPLPQSLCSGLVGSLGPAMQGMALRYV
jgi:hypothetical protein